jgi:hypothetical protein
MKKINLLIITVCLFFITNKILFGQSCFDTLFRKNIDSISIQLTKEQMYEDYDTLVKIISSSTHSLVNKVSTSYDVELYLKKRRAKIENISSYMDFIIFLKRTLPFTLAPHCRMANEHDCEYAMGSKFVDTMMVRLISDAYLYRESAFDPYQYSFAQLGKGFYYNGNYYVFGRYTFIHRNTNDSILLSDFRILKQNQEDQKSIDIFDSQVSGSSAASVRWDYRLRKHYMANGLYIPRSNKILAEDYSTKQQFDFSPIDYSMRISGASLSEEEISSLPHEQSDNMKVTYYDSLRLLYIYLGSMVYDNGSFANSAKKAGIGKQIDKIILDIRDNNGGSDYTWRHLLSLIVKKPLYGNALLGVRNTEIMKKIFEDNVETNQIPASIIRREQIPYLNNEDFFIQTSGLDDKGDSLCIVPPDSSSLMYDGKIYILQNDNVYSSAGALTAYAQRIPQLITVGVPTGLVGGRGLPPAIFQLPNSKFSFLMDVFVDLTDAKTAADVRHDKPEIEIYPTIDEIIEMNNYGFFLNKRGDEFLFKHDYLFKKALEMK